MLGKLFDLRDGDDLSTSGKIVGPIVSLVWRFHSSTPFLLEELGFGKVLSLIVLDAPDRVCTGTWVTHTQTYNTPQK